MIELPIAMSRIIFECEVIVWGWKPARFTNQKLTGLLLCPSNIADLQGRLHDLMGQFLLGFLNYASPYPCHSTCEIDLNTIEPALLAQSASGILGLNVQPECIQTMVIYYYGLRIS